jgi:glycosyltransferase involved in cell wall biosynthesis
MARPAVAVAIASYQGAHHIEAQLRSILSQTVPPAEIVLADDGSRDGTVDRAVEVVDASGMAVPLRVVARDRVGGVVANFSRALVAVRHPLVALADQDDVWHPDRLEAALDRFGDPAVSLVHGDALLVDKAGRDLGTAFAAIGYGPDDWRRVRSGEAFELLLRRNVVTGAATMLRRELIARALPVPDGWIHDEWLAIVAASSDGVDVVERPIIDYRQHGENQIGLQELSFRGRVGRMLEPGGPRNERLLRRAASLVDRIESGKLPVSDARRAAAREKLEHERMRSALSRHRVARVVPVLRELRTDRYRRFGRGAADAARDLLQPLGRHADSGG